MRTRRRTIEAGAVSAASPSRRSRPPGRRRTGRVAARHDPIADQLVNEVADAALGGEVDRRRRALLAGQDLAQIHRLAEVPDSVAPIRIIASPGVLEGDRACFAVGEQADAADGGRRQDAAAVGLVVKGDVARHDREVEGAAGFADAFDGADELAHDLGLFGVAEVQVVGGANGGAPVAVRLRQLPPPPVCRPRTDRPRRSAASRRR